MSARSGSPSPYSANVDPDSDDEAASFFLENLVDEVMEERKDDTDDPDMEALSDSAAY